MKGILKSINQGFIASCHDVSEGGLGVCLAEMCIGGNMGASVDITGINNTIRDDMVLFSESNTRWVIEVHKTKQDIFEKHLLQQQVPFKLLGNTQPKTLHITSQEKTLSNISIPVLQKAWKQTLWNMVG